MLTQTSRLQGTLTAEFSHFPKLPLELRLKIWELAIDQRIVRLQYGTLDEPAPNQDIPAMMSVSREA